LELSSRCKTVNAAEPLPRPPAALRRLQFIRGAEDYAAALAAPESTLPTSPPAPGKPSNAARSAPTPAASAAATAVSSASVAAAAAVAGPGLGRLRFDLQFLMQGVRLRAVAPDAALLLDTGRFALRVRRGTRLAGGGFDDSAVDAVSWTCGLDGLSVAATSASPCPGLRPAAGMTLGPLPTHRSSSSAATAGSPAIGMEQRLWVLAHAQTNLSIRNGGGAEPAAWDGGGEGAAARAAESWWRGDGTRLALTLRQTDAQAHPGSVACLASLLRHYAAAFASYRQERRALGLDVARLDRALTRVVETGRTAAQGRIRRQAPEIIQDLVVSHVYCHACFS
jgi:hypothetical protein